MFKSFFKRRSAASDLPAPEVDLKRWYANPRNAERLDEILNDPVYRQAVAIAKARQAPYGGKTIASSPEVNANIANWWAGFHDFPHILSTLAVPRNKDTTNTPDPDQEWMHLKTPNQ